MTSTPISSPSAAIRCWRCGWRRSSRELARQVTPGQVMVASTVGKLSALLASDLSDEQAQRLGFDALLPLRESDGPTLFCFHPASGFAGSSACWRVILTRAGQLPVFSRRVRRGRWLPPPTSTKSASTICARFAQQPHGPYYLFGYSLGGTLAQGLPPVYASAAKRWRSSACWIPPPETQNWAEKEANGLDPEVLAEIAREREAFLAAQQGQASGELFSAIEGNYADAVRLLTTAHSAKFDGKATLFVAEKRARKGWIRRSHGAMGWRAGGVQPELRPRRDYLAAGL